MTMETHRLHRRKSSKEEDDNLALVTRPVERDGQPDLQSISPPSPRSRVQSSPGHPHHTHSRSISSVGLGPAPQSAGTRNGFTFPRPPNGIANGHPPHAPSSFRSSLAGRALAPPSAGGHSRTRSVSAFSPSVHSPLAPGFLSMGPQPFPSFPQNGSLALRETTPPPPPPPHRHQRIHSRNLSIFFPRPGSLPHKSISEDDHEARVDEEAPVAPIPSAGSSIRFPGSRDGHEPPTPLRANFTFGGRPPSLNGTAAPASDIGRARSPTSSTSNRRGHHHKHSMSHNFFSFLEPGANLRPPSQDELHTQPTPVPLSPWAPPSTPSSGGSDMTSNGHHDSHLSHLPKERRGDMDEDQQPPGVVAVGFFQFVLGAWLWVSGQQTGSLSITGLGYWVVFDAFGVGLCGFLPQWLKLRRRKSEAPSERQRRNLRRSYGNAPVETVFMFAQAVYLMFAAVYVCKEAVEHLLLSTGGEEGHHHHRGDEDDVAGIDFPVILAFVTLLSVAGTSLIYNNHSKLVNVTGNRISSLHSLIRSLRSSSRSQFHDPPPTSPLGIMLSNPFTSSPMLFCVAVLGVALLVPDAQQRTFDLVLAAFIAVITFRVAYRACTILGTVLLQTAPARGSSSRKMEAFLRAMREIERHPQVLHLPAPHIWQLTPSPSLYFPAASGKMSGPSTAESLVITLELHVKRGLGDDDVLKLTRWAWEKCANALGSRRARSEEGGCGTGGPEVTVGVVRG